MLMTMKKFFFVLQEILKSNKYSVVTANNGAKALEKARLDPPDIIISDILMPVMDGFTLCHEWKHDELLKEIPFIIYSSEYTDKTDENLALRLGVDSFIRKSTAPGEFIMIVKDIIESMEGGNQRARMPISKEDDNKDDIFKLYNERLVMKLEQKMLDLEMEVYRRKTAEEEFKEIVETSLDGFYIVDSRTRFVYVNDAFCEIEGYSKEELLNMTVLDLEVIEDQEAIAQRVEKVLTEGFDRFETKHRRKDGKIIDVSISVKSKDQGNRFVAFVRDITESKQIEMAIFQAEERERQRIGYELHDGLGQLLTGISFSVQNLEEDLKEKMLPEAEDAKRISSIIDHAKKQVRRVAAGISPIQTDIEGLILSLKELADNTSKVFNVSCVFKYDKAVSIFNKPSIAHLFRIAQEAVTNSVKHGNPEHIEIGLSRKSDKIELLIKDDGKGFRTMVKQTKGMGLQIIGYRATMIGALIDINSDTNSGTEVKCSFYDKAHI